MCDVLLPPGVNRIAVKNKYIYYIFLISGLTFGLLGKGEPVLTNSIPGATDDGKCERLEEEVARADRDTVVEEPPRLNGKWVSEG
jgi:hypothetical protein